MATATGSGSAEYSVGPFDPPGTALARREKAIEDATAAAEAAFQADLAVWTWVWPFAAVSPPVTNIAFNAVPPAGPPGNINPRTRVTVTITANLFLPSSGL